MSARWGRLAAAVVATALLALVLGACTVPPPGGPTACNLPPAPASGQYTITVDGTVRTYELAIPPGYTGTSRVPVVFDFHGAGSSGRIQDTYSQTSVKVAPRGWVVVSPNGLTNGWFSFWYLPPASSTDVHFVSELLRSLSSRLCLDSRRVFATGLSDGAALADALVCSLPGTFAAVSPVGAVNFGSVCTAGNPRTSLLAFHGNADPIFPYGGNQTVTSVPSAVAAWAAFDGCATTPTETPVAVDVVRSTYPSCRDGTGVELYTILDGGHNWPDGYQYTVPYGRMTTSINATDIMLDFFAAHPRPG
jgi:polyhydroxybutyrate depolymerase